LARVADVLAGHRARWGEIARINSGNTAADAVIDIDGAIGTLKYFAKLGAGTAGNGRLLDGPVVRLGRDPSLQGAHIGVPVDGVAVHINAFNFPAWGLWEKAAVSLLAGVPVFTKPASSTAWLAQEMVRVVVEAGVLPDGSLSMLCGPAGDLLDHLQFGDVVAFTGSANTAERLRAHPALRAGGVRLNIEADSLNASVLGPDQGPDSPAFGLLVREVVREMTVKAGQKCTAIRRVLVPRAHEAALTEAVVAGLEKVIVGDPSNPSVNMGPLANFAQRATVRESIEALTADADQAFGTQPVQLVDADEAQGAFVGPALFRAADRSRLVHTLEVFGPVATVVPYANEDEAVRLAKAGGGSLVASVFSSDVAFLARAASEIGAAHGRVLLVDPSVGSSHAGHGIVMPSCTHGGPGRAGGGEELGGLRSLWFYHQRVAVQGAATVVAAIRDGGIDTGQG
jgi:3,4-dehydroadipyl-CoA semialdehyde dehydrogenase